MRYIQKVIRVHRFSSNRKRHSPMKKDMAISMKYCVPLNVLHRLYLQKKKDRQRMSVPMSTCSPVLSIVSSVYPKICLLRFSPLPELPDGVPTELRKWNLPTGSSVLPIVISAKKTSSIFHYPDVKNQRIKSPLIFSFLSFYNPFIQNAGKYS